MRAFIKHIVIILGIIVASLYLLDALYEQVLSKGQPRSKIQHIVNATDTHYDYAFFGSSRVENHIDCDLIEKLTGKSCVNFGMAGTSLADLTLALDILTYNECTFDKVLVQVDYSYNKTGKTKVFESQLIPSMKHPVVRKAFENHPKKWQYANIPFYRFMVNDKVLGVRELTATVMKKEAKVDFENGFVPLYGTATNIKGAFPEKMIKDNPSYHELLAFAANTETEVIFFTAPYCKEVKNVTFMRTLKTEIPALVDYTQKYDSVPTFFKDCGHLNREGAMDFSRIIAEDLLTPSN